MYQEMDPVLCLKPLKGPMDSNNWCYMRPDRVVLLLPIKLLKHDPRPPRGHQGSPKNCIFQRVRTESTWDPALGQGIHPREQIDWNLVRAQCALTQVAAIPGLPPS